MIPERISVQGFLCYRDRQEAYFDGRKLWMLSGPNGSGKSALFDAITFALYGAHRGGRQNAEALINRQSDGFVVEFDFRIEDEIFQARRTLSRSGLPTRQIRRWLPSPVGGRWQEISGTDSQKGFETWVLEQIGLTIETFTASVMLRQNRADRLLEAKPSERHEFLKEIVGLHYYERLHETAKAHLSRAKARAEDLSRRLQQLPQTTPEEFSQAEVLVSEAEKARSEAADCATSLSEQLVHSERWSKLDQDRQAIEQKIESFHALLNEQEKIKRDYEEFQFLNRHLSTLRSSIELHERLRGEEWKFVEVRDRITALMKEAEPLTSKSSQIARDIEEAESLRGREHAECQETERRLHGLGQALPWLEMLSAERKVIASTREKTKFASAALEKIEADSNAIAAEALPTETLQEAEENLHRLKTELGASAQRRRETAERLERFQEIRHEQTCRYCGQELPPEHVRAEAELLQKERDAAHSAFQQIQADHQSALARQRQFLEQKIHCENRLQELENQRQKALAELESLKSEEAAGHHRRRQAADSLPEAFQTRFAEQNGSFPSDEELATYHAERTDLTQRRQRHQEILNELDIRLKQLRKDHKSLQEQRQNLIEEQNELQKALVFHETRRDSLRESIETDRHRLPEDWRNWPLEEAKTQCPRLEHRLGELSSESIEQQFQQLQTAKREHETNGALLANLMTQIEDIPEPARRPPDEVMRDVDQSKQQLAQCEKLYEEARERLSELRRRIEERESLRKQSLAAERRRHLWDRLVKLLGTHELQRHLVRQAERQIVGYAQAILDRLSSGTMHIELAPEIEDTRPKALDLIAKTDGRPEPLGADFLSGSQRFRVAVALSLAIGQYAGRSRRPVRSVVIDEGFGCLDTENRQVMIQELHNLKDHLDRILLVSHQEEFAQAFPDGYRCEPGEQGTHLIPVHR